MIPEIEDVLSGYAFYARRYKLPDANEREVMVALKLARTRPRSGVRRASRHAVRVHGRAQTPSIARGQMVS